MPDHAPWRPDLYVVARLLEHLWRQEVPVLKTHLQLAANVNYDVFTRYLEWMRHKGLIEFQNSPDGRDRLTLTPDGHEAYRRLVQWVNEVVHGRMPGE